MKTWLVKLTVDIAAYVKLPDDWSEDAVKFLVVPVVSLAPTGDNAVTLKIENTVIDDIVEVHEDKG